MDKPDVDVRNCSATFPVNASNLFKDFDESFDCVLNFIVGDVAVEDESLGSS